MRLNAIIIKVLVLLIPFFTGANKMYGQNGKDSLANKELYNEIAKMDSILFNAFNTRDVVKFGSIFTKDLEFYHDKGGLTGYEYTMNFMKDLTKNKSNDLKRELVKGSLEVYPIPGYGAMEIGAHTFCHSENGKQDCGTSKFVHIWKKENGAWKISRVVSYDH